MAEKKQGFVEKVREFVQGYRERREQKAAEDRAQGAAVDRAKQRRADLGIKEPKFLGERVSEMLGRDRISFQQIWQDGSLTLGDKIGETVSAVKEFYSDPSIGKGHLTAWARAGFNEIGQALVAFPTTGIHPSEQAGLFGVASQGEIFSERTGQKSNVYGTGAKDEGSVHGKRQSASERDKEAQQVKTTKRRGMSM